MGRKGRGNGRADTKVVECLDLRACDVLFISLDKAMIVGS